ncbi:MAG: leucine-rich repeat domain-containing protein [Promethearchaeota archaeon]
MSERKHGRRYSFKEKKDILDYLGKHTYKDTSEKFKISETTLSRWRKEIKSGSKYNRSKIIISLPKFWIEYLNDQIESDVWEDYSDAILNLIRYYFKAKTSIHNVDSSYLKNIEKVVSTFLKSNPHIDSVALANSTKVLYKTERWGSTEGLIQFIESWKKSGKREEIQFENNNYFIRDISVKHLICAPKTQNLGFLLLLRKKMEKDDVYIIAKTKALGKFTIGAAKINIGVAMNTLKKIAMGKLPTTREQKLYMDKSEETEYLNRVSKTFQRLSDEYHQEKRKLDQNQLFKIKTYPLLMQLATQVNKPLKPDEKEVLDVIQKQLGRTIERITADPGQETNKRELYGLPWLRPDEGFPASKFPCHYVALNGEIILLSLVNLGLSEAPSEILNFKNLRYLNLGSNTLSELPKSFKDLESLEFLILNDNQFTEIPDCIIKLPRLTYLYMKNNSISNIPVALTDTWQARLEDPNYQGSIYLPSNMIFSGNPIDRNSLTEKQLELEQKSNLNMYRYFFFVID